MELNRRDFLKSSTAATGLLLLQSPVSALASDSQTTEGLAMLIDVTKCVGCWACFRACKSDNELSTTAEPNWDEPPALEPETWTTLKPIKIDEKYHFRKQACNHCADAACVGVCPTGALSYNDLGFVQYDSEECSGCGYCAEFCPFDVPQLESNQVTGIAVMNKCTFCIDRVTNGQPTACAESCPVGAIKFGQRSELLQEGKERVAAQQQDNPNIMFYGEEELGGLHVMYVLDAAPEDYDLPSDPQVPATSAIRDVLKWVGVGAAAAIVAGFGLNYLVARMRMARGR